MKIKEPKAKDQMFSSGKIVYLGIKNEEQPKNACMKFAQNLKKFGYNVNIAN